VLRVNETGERIPLTIADFTKKTITLVILVVGKTTEELTKLRKNDSILDLAGPLGNKSEIKQYGSVCLIGGGLGIAPIYPIAKALKKENDITIILGAKSKNYLFWEDKFKQLTKNVIICTDDGSKGKHGFVSKVLKKLMEERRFEMVITIGPPIMMKVIADLTRDRMRTKVSLNPLMVDGIGMCGGCRVVIDGKIRFTCSDGPEFDAHKVDWNELITRNKTYLDEEELCKRH
ncbi:unnamed protein product, partial [marine sediment metagenome]